MTTQQPEALRLANILRGIDARSLFANEKLSAASAALENQHARITELESQLAQRFDAADMATAAAQGFRDGAAKEQQEGWQPIETAPKDSSYVLLAGKHRKDIASGYWLQSAYAGNGAWIWPFVHKYPTHWIPLPAPRPADGESNETQ
jgi:hypothetical protein